MKQDNRPVVRLTPEQRVEPKKSLTELYQEAQFHLESIAQWRAAMIQSVRNEAMSRISFVREGFMIEDVEAKFKAMALKLVKEIDSTSEVKEYVFTSDGLEVLFTTSNENIQSYTYKYADLERCMLES